MDLFTKLFGDFLVFVYHCFDRIVIRGYLTALSRPELVVHFFREVSKEALSQRTADYQNWVEAYARNHAIPIEWAEKGVRKEDHVLRASATPLPMFPGTRIPTLSNFALGKNPKSRISAMISLKRGDATTLLSIRMRSRLGPYASSMACTKWVRDSVSR